MRRIHRLLIPLGAVLLLFGVVSYALTLRLDSWTAVHLALGAALLAWGVLLDLAGFRRTVIERGTRERAQALGGSLLFGGILVALNILAARHPWRFDATENKVHTLTPRTEALVSGLEDPVELFAFLEPGDATREDLEDLLARYSALGSKLTWRIVDAEREPQLADQLGVQRHGTLVARARGTTAQAAADDPGGLSEAAVSNLVLKVSQPGPRALYFLTGHGEPRIDDTREARGLGLVAEALRAQNLDPRELLLATTAGVPDDASAVLVVGPQKPLLEHEASALAAYLERGGRALFLLDPETDAGLAPVLERYRIALGDDVVVDQQEHPLFGARLGLNPLVESFLPHAITRGFGERVVLLEARSVEVRFEGGAAGVEAHALAETRSGSWAERDYRAMFETGTVSEDPVDLQGPVPVAAAAERAGAEGAAAGDDARKGKGSRIVVVGDSDFAVNANLDRFFNREFLLRAVEWLAGRDEMIAEGPRGLRPSRLDITESSFWTLFRASVLLLPEILLLFGLAVWWRRRSL